MFRDSRILSWYFFQIFYFCSTHSSSKLLDVHVCACIFPIDLFCFNLLRDMEILNFNYQYRRNRKMEYKFTYLVYRVVQTGSLKSWVLSSRKTTLPLISIIIKFYTGKPVFLWPRAANRKNEPRFCCVPGVTRRNEMQRYKVTRKSKAVFEVRVNFRSRRWQCMIGRTTWRTLSWPFLPMNFIVIFMIFLVVMKFTFIIFHFFLIGFRFLNRAFE